MIDNSDMLDKTLPSALHRDRPVKCSECFHWSNFCRLGYSVTAYSKSCRHGLKRVNRVANAVKGKVIVEDNDDFNSVVQKKTSKNPHFQPTATDVNCNFNVVGEIVWSSSGKTVKLYLHQKGSRCFIGQVSRQSLVDLIEKQCLNADITKYQNTNTGDHSEQ
ncbi:MAG: hypothetical protein LBE76_08145 [Nitrososphaerota archaeon]|jgi:hypothetical protein|nr:hypothetical protein [Nitrososphaerota archaeon]